MSTFRKRKYGWSASCTVWQFHRQIGAFKSKNKIKKRKKPTTPISQKVTHPSRTFSQQGLTSVTSKSTWSIAIWDDDEKTVPKCLRGLLILRHYIKMLFHVRTLAYVNTWKQNKSRNAFLGFLISQIDLFKHCPTLTITSVLVAKAR